ncbi:MAG: pyrroline-5-carboxylate reductase [Bacteroidetes bacterium]|nr:MAG: pyrroline-5-carboxylate reductase [Bacteroidota bacterium]TAG85745.1 MAG: pyrroline-5-carboxylate reductase [Bacteroidota bacterium]
MKILLIGAGNMGQTYADSFIAQKVVKKENLFILEHLPEKVEQLQKKGYQQIWLTPTQEIIEMNLIILAVKPQDSNSLFENIKSWILPSHLILSIMAGVTMEGIKKGLPTQKIVRAMPNLPAQISMGMTGFTADISVNREEIFSVQNLLNTTGKTLFFEKEEMLDAVTAVSGSGPAYIFYFMKAMMKSAMEMGFSETQSEMLVEQTFMGAVHLFNNNTFSCEEWIAKVASKGGTTEAALKDFNANLLEDKIGNGLQQALKRAIELGR